MSQRHLQSRRLVLCGILLIPVASAVAKSPGAVPSGATSRPAAWTIGTPIATYWAGPRLTDAVAKRMIEGGWNLVWCNEKELDVAQRHGLRGLLHLGVNRNTIDDPEQTARLTAVIDRVRQHPALYAYHLVDEPSASHFPALGKVVALIRRKDPAHLAYINLFPTYANNKQLGTKGDVVTAYRKHLDQYLETVKPDLISYDHYHFAVKGDRDQYFLNLGMIRQTALDAGLPFLNIVQACSWHPSMRVPNERELRWLVHTSLAYGAQGISYYVYCHANHTGAMAELDGVTPTPLYHAAKVLNREFVAIAAQVQPLRSLGAYHTGVIPQGAVPLPKDAAFRLVPPSTTQPAKPGPAYVLGHFGTPGKPTHVMVVNLNYKKETTATVVGPAPLEVFDTTTKAWTPAGGSRAQLRFPPGGGKLLRVRR